jgi:hypothetical protein
VPFGALGGRPAYNLMTTQKCGIGWVTWEM